MYIGTLWKTKIDKSKNKPQTPDFSTETPNLRLSYAPAGGGTRTRYFLLYNYRK
jgi:hypothetical protein